MNSKEIIIFIAFTIKIIGIAIEWVTCRHLLRCLMYIQATTKLLGKVDKRKTKLCRQLSSAGKSCNIWASGKWSFVKKLQYIRTAVDNTKFEYYWLKRICESIAFQMECL